jgi:SAM-dependent methyltransferase
MLALEQPGKVGLLAARRLVAELHFVAEEAAELARTFRAMRGRIAPPLHNLRVQALLRAERALGSLAGRRVLEVGCQDGGLLLHLEALGADVMGVDLGPEIDHPRVLRGDFMTAELEGPFDLIVATSVFEKFSNARGEPEPDRGNTRPVLLQRFRELTREGGVVVLENIMFPLPFSRAHALEADFEVLPERIPSANHCLGGRGCTLRRLSTSG